MNINYIQYEDKYYNDLKKITHTSFELTSFNTDKQISQNQANQVAWELWCKPVLKSNKNKYCVIAVHQNKAVGYIIYGADAEYSKLLDLKIGSVILMAVDKKYQGKFNIALDLINYVLNIYKKYEMNIVTVGTDLDNLPALINYINAGFRPILFWSTFRYYYKNPQFQFKEDKSIKISKRKKVKIVNLKNFSRPVSFFMDKRFDKPLKQKIDTYIRKRILSGIKKEKLELFNIEQKKKTIGLITVMKERSLSKILDKTIYRINDIIFFHNDIDLNITILHSLLKYLLKQERDISTVEIFIKSNDWEVIEALIKAGFIPVHNSVTLHKFL